MARTKDFMKTIYTQIRETASPSKILLHFPVIPRRREPRRRRKILPSRRIDHPPANVDQQAYIRIHRSPRNFLQTTPLRSNPRDQKEMIWRNQPYPLKRLYL